MDNQFYIVRKSNEKEGSVYSEEPDYSKFEDETYEESKYQKSINEGLKINRKIICIRKSNERFSKIIHSNKDIEISNKDLEIVLDKLRISEKIINNYNLNKES